MRRITDGLFKQGSRRFGIALGDAGQGLGGGRANRFAPLMQNPGQQGGGGIGRSGDIAEGQGAHAPGGRIAGAQHGLEHGQHAVGAAARGGSQGAHSLGAHQALSVFGSCLQDLQCRRLHSCLSRIPGRAVVALALGPKASDPLGPMLSNLEIHGFRTFAHLRIDGLARVNLFVGANNCGKTSVLEAGEILLAGGRPWILLRSPTRRGDGFLPEGRFAPQTVDIRHLFHGHELKIGASFTIEGGGTRQRRVSCEVVQASSGDERPAQPELLGLVSDPIGPLGPGGPSGPGAFGPEESLAITVSGDQTGANRVLGLAEGGGLSISLASRPTAREEGEESPFNFIGTVDPDYRLAPLWDKIVLTPNEDRVTQALQIIEPSIERVASLSRPSGRGTPSPIVVRLRGSEARVPIGSMGDGLKRLLVLSVNLVTSAGGCLFVDEIDSGLHYSVIAKMWQLLIETARRLDVQVCASTHSLDCLQALAGVCEKKPDLAGEVAVHRLEKDQETATRYGADELALAVRHEMEIR